MPTGAYRCDHPDCNGVHGRRKSVNGKRGLRPRAELCPAALARLRAKGNKRYENPAYRENRKATQLHYYHRKQLAQLLQEAG